MADLKFDIGDPVWSKMKGYCPWPSRIAAPHESSLENKEKQKNQKTFYLVFFFGSNNFAWMPEDTVKPYHEFKDKNKNGSKTNQFRAGLKAIEEYIASGGKATLDIPPDSEVNKNNSSNNDNATSAHVDSPEQSTNNDGDLPSIEEEILTIKNNKPASSRKTKNAHDSHNDSSSLTSPAPSSVQRDYSRTPFKTGRKIIKNDEPTTELTSPTKRAKTSEDDSYVSSLSSPTISTAIGSHKQQTANKHVRSVLMRTQGSHFSELPTLDTPQVNLKDVPAKLRNIRPSSLKIGFIGMGSLGQRLVRLLMNSNHKVVIYNRTSGKCKEFVEAGATSVSTPEDVVRESDIIFSCVSDSEASREVVFGKFGTVDVMDSTKGFVEMSSIDLETSKDISEAIISRGGRYLVAPPILAGISTAEAGDLVIVASGDRSLYEDCSSCFAAMSKKTTFLSHEVGNATKMNLILSTFYGNIVASVSECMNMIDDAELSGSDFKDILKLTAMHSTLAETQCKKMLEGYKLLSARTDMSLTQLQRNMRMAIATADVQSSDTSVTAASNELLKNAKRVGYQDNDVAAVYLVKSRFNHGY